MTDTQLKDSARQLLTENILRFWEEHMFDPNGGFYGRMTGHGVLDTHAERGAVLNARILWTFSAAYRIFHDPRYLAMATHAKNYFLDYFVDQQFGGVFWSVSADGKPLSTKKQTYAISFAIYALSEYARAAADTHAVNMAIRLYEDIEQYTFDPVHVGYAEALTRQWQPIVDMRLSDKDEYATRTMNTHLHVMEAYTNLYRIWPDPQLKQSIQTLLNIFAQKLYNPTNGHIDLFFNDTWQGKRNIASYGHDIEAAWLLNEALQVIGDADMQQSMQLIIEHIARASQEGLQSDGSLIHETNDEQRQWWVECEAVVGYLDQWQQSGNPRYRQLALQTYDYILHHLVDYDHGEWYWAILPDGSIDKENDKAGLWKCPYHNSRMCFEIIERL
ncbi:MAG: AGE family epimerase/isomerase [Paludibacteraceae bacterium]|nr:AGE family epimerase/isomerase [Paludibacteraceae bacterium]